jgi:hypothetical protein
MEDEIHRKMYTKTSVGMQGEKEEIHEVEEESTQSRV